MLDINAYLNTTSGYYCKACEIQHGMLSDGSRPSDLLTRLFRASDPDVCIVQFHQLQH